LTTLRGVQIPALHIQFVRTWQEQQRYICSVDTTEQIAEYPVIQNSSKSKGFCP
jgi:hypothetical protein